MASNKVGGDNETERCRTSAGLQLIYSVYESSRIDTGGTGGFSCHGRENATFLPYHAASDRFTLIQDLIMTNVVRTERKTHIPTAS